jgi:hypothetical protein
MKSAVYHEISLSRIVLCCRYGATGRLKKRGSTKDQQMVIVQGLL